MSFDRTPGPCQSKFIYNQVAGWVHLCKFVESREFFRCAIFESRTPQVTESRRCPSSPRKRRGESGHWGFFNGKLGAAFLRFTHAVVVTAQLHQFGVRTHLNNFTVVQNHNQI